MSFWLRFVTKRDFDCEQVKQQTSQPELTRLADRTVRPSAWSRLCYSVAAVCRLYGMHCG